MSLGDITRHTVGSLKFTFIGNCLQITGMTILPTSRVPKKEQDTAGNF